MRVDRLFSGLFLLVLLCTDSLAQQQDGIVTAEQTFTFISNTWQGYLRDGELSDEIGLATAQRTDFLLLIERFYREFIEGFAPDSNFCRTYHDPRNGIFEIEERALLASAYLRSLGNRLERFQRLDGEFLEAVEGSFGAAIRDSVIRLRADAVSFEYLPSRELGPAELINFADTACR